MLAREMHHLDHESGNHGKCKEQNLRELIAHELLYPLALPLDT